MKEKIYPANTDSIPDILSDIRGFLEKLKKNQSSITEYELLSEELLVKLIEAADDDIKMMVRFKRNGTDSSITFYCMGTPIVLDGNQSDIGTDIILDYAERISQTRKHGLNKIMVSAGTSSNNMSVKLIISGALAILTDIIMYFALNDSQIAWLDEQVFNPILMIFIKLLQNFAVPMAFISLLAYVINFYSSVEFGGQLKKVALKYMDTSVIATMIPFAIVALTGAKLSGNADETVGGLSLKSTGTIYVMGKSLKEFLEGLLPDNILDVFSVSNPLPVLLIAILLGLVINSYSGEGNEKIRSAVNTTKSFVSRIVTFIYSMMPFFFYIAIVDFALFELKVGDLLNSVKNILFIAAMVLLTFTVHILVYFLEIRANGIRIKDFMLKYKEMIWENFRIASNIDALPYNRRMFRRKLHDPEKNLLVGAMLNLGSNVNMDGNCLIITTTIMIFCYSMNYDMNLLFLGELLAIIMLLGIGSPNQPGSFTIAMLVLIEFLGLSSKLAMFLIIFEGLFLKLYSTINAFGDIVAVVVTADDELKNAHKKKEKTA